MPMRHLFRKITSGFILGANFLVIILFLFSCLTPHLHPGKWWFTGFMGLAFPYLLALLLGFLIFWLVVHPRKSLFSLGALILGAGSIGTLIAFGSTKSLPRVPEQGSIRIMSWNVRYFVPFRKERFQGDESANVQAILDEIRTHRPDVICFQEFYNNGEKGQDMIARMSRDLGYPYYYFSRDQVHWRTIVTGTAIFSRYPLIQSRRIPYPEAIEEGAESTILADMVVAGDTLRIANFHLQSFRFMPRDYQSLGVIKNQQDKGLEASKKIIRKMQNTFYLHGEQSDFVRRQLDQSPYPLVVCGDLNDVPNSYAYLNIRGDMQDAFLEIGSGIGKTFTSASSRLLGKLPTLRIDYIFASPDLKTSGFQMVRKPLSDHFGLLADLELPKKE